MDFKHYKTVFLIAIIFWLILVIPTKSFSTNFAQSFSFHTKIGYVETKHELYMSVPISLYNYYKDQNRNIFNIEDYSKFVTPNVFKSVAENIQNISRLNPYSDEVFANAVLEIVHQIPYNITNTKFPTETIVENSGDCDTLSLLAASIMKAGNLDVVLFFYEDSNVSHINVGVHLPNNPVFTGWAKPFYYEYNGKKYFTAETTANSYNVGNQPLDFINIEPQIISLQNCEKTSPTEISSSVDSSLVPSFISLSLNADSLKVENGRTNITLSGSISPRIPEQKVNINVKHEPSALDIQKTVITDNLGNYYLTWTFDTIGTFTFQSSWKGIKNYACSESEKLAFTIGLRQLLDTHEVNRSAIVGSELIPTPSLDSYGNRIVTSQPIKKIFEKNFTGTEILIGAELFVLGTDETYFTEQNITRPSYEQQFVIGGKNFTRIVPEETVIIPNYRQHMHNHVEFTLIQNGENYNVRMRLLDNSDISKIIAESDSTLIDASSYVQENMWYNLAANITEDKIIVTMFSENNTYLTKIVPIDYTNSTNELKILIEYEPDSVIVLKDLQAEIPNQPTRLIEEELVEKFDLSIIIAITGLMVLPLIVIIFIFSKPKRA